MTIYVVSVSAQTILYNNLDKTVYDNAINTAMGQQFKTTASLHFIYEVELGIFRDAYIEGNFTVSIYSNNESDELGSKVVDIYTGSNSVLSTNSGSTFKIDQTNDYNNCLPYELSANTKYWIVVNSTEDFVCIWDYTIDNAGDGDGFLTRNYTTDFSIPYIDNSPYLLKILAHNVLPVELNSFTCSVLNNNVILNWQTATEVNNYGFEIERAVILRQAQDDNVTLNIMTLSSCS